ncbi:hypothetical protein EPA93_07575 [Ktedonosporobacter rubrisoli]|uniref:DUF3817 domain-containing protein n=1 Tax=Ktedonosporobacter rubrisoli TaxID=2509675 RepID=A0A4P6JL26_KTERU|nr:DUF3817 domain-containing protein [Ktedonosporobacter rubrisoli]QBD75874.1 hypothetical protein EPA93_07575 [Ktedonosporobacter rubrisoli]
MTSIQQAERLSNRLRIVRLAALIDLVLLLALVSAALSGQKEIVHVLGPLHGINFLLLLVIAGVGAIDGLWKWWFPVAVLLTAGPPGAFVGELIITRRLRQQNTLPGSDAPTALSKTRETDVHGARLASHGERALDRRGE